MKKGLFFECRWNDVHSRIYDCGTHFCAYLEGPRVASYLANFGEDEDNLMGIFPLDTSYVSLEGGVLGFDTWYTYLEGSFRREIIEMTLGNVDTFREIYSEKMSAAF